MPMVAEPTARAATLQRMADVVLRDEHPVQVPLEHADLALVQRGQRPAVGDLGVGQGPQARRPQGTFQVQVETVYTWGYVYDTTITVDLWEGPQPTTQQIVDQHGDCKLLQGAQIIAHPANLVLPYCQQAMLTRSLENGVFSITANRYGPETLRVAALYGSLIGLGIHGLIVLPLILRLVARRPILPYAGGMLEALTTAWSTASSSRAMSGRSRSQGS